MANYHLVGGLVPLALCNANKVSATEATATQKIKASHFLRHYYTLKVQLCTSTWTCENQPSIPDRVERTLGRTCKLHTTSCVRLAVSSPNNSDNIVHGS